MDEKTAKAAAGERAELTALSAVEGAVKAAVGALDGAQGEIAAGVRSTLAAVLGMLAQERDHITTLPA